MTSITVIVRGRMKSVLLEAIVGQPTLNSVQHLVKQLATFASHFATTKWGGKHGFLLLVLSKAKMRPAAGGNKLDCKRLKKPELINTIIEYSTQGQELLKFQADQKVEWQEYTFQEGVDLVAVKAIIAAVDTKYVE